MFQLACTVRNCQKPLAVVEGGLQCANRHCFDRAKQGYYNLLQPQDSRSSKPGDSDEAVDARQRWLDHGHMAGLVDVLLPWCETANQKTTQVIDLGCGEGTFAAALFGESLSGYCGIDLSRRAIRLAARKLPKATWVQANADRRLPAIDGTVDRILSLFGRRPIAEIKRTLAIDGRCIIAVPGADDLLELREHVQEAGIQRNRWQNIVEQFAEHELRLLKHTQWLHRVRLDRRQIADALAMTYRAVRNSQQQRLESLDSAEVSLNAGLLLVQHA